MFKFTAAEWVFLLAILDVSLPLVLGCNTPCTQNSDCHDPTNAIGLNRECGELSCISGTCQFEAWKDSGSCAGSNFLECTGNDSKCTKGPSALNYDASCTGWGNNECIYQWCPRDQGTVTTTAPPLTLPTTATPPVTDPPPVPQTGIWRPPPGTSWQWQLTGTINTSFDVDMYDIDLFDTPQSVIDKLHNDGRIVICYFSAGTFEDWRPDKNAFGSNLKGSPLGDWPGETWLDIRKIADLGPIMQARLDLAVSKKCDGAEPDNIDGYQNGNGLGLTYNDQIVYNRWLASEAHSRGLSIGLKNDLNQVSDLIDDFDWAINEECYQYNECELLLPFVDAGKAVFGVEYQGRPARFCPKLNSMQFSWLKKGLNLGASSTDCSNF